MSPSTQPSPITDLPIQCVILTVSCSEESDRKAADTVDWLKSRCAEADLVLRGCETIKDDQNVLIQAIRTATKLNPPVDLMLICGEQSFARNDLWLEVTDNLLEKKIPGFAERLRSLAFSRHDENDAMYIRANAGIYRCMLVFAMPLDLTDVQVAMNDLILPGVKKHVWEMRQRKQ